MKGSLLAEKALIKHDWPLIEVDGLTLIRSPLLSTFANLAHAFTTRLGGNSPPPLEWFNLGRHRTDRRSHQDALDNRQRLCDVLGLGSGSGSPATKLTVPGQKHTTNIYVIDDRQSAVNDQSLSDRDGAATNACGWPILLHFADCVPIIMFDARRQALCVLHAGWKGTAGSITAAAVQLLGKRFDCRPEDVAAAIGPAIGSCCYPTGDDVAHQLAGSIGDARALITRRGGQPCPDLKAVNAMQLLESGVREVDVASWCTACHPELFYSHRQAKGQTGRQGAIACIKPSA